MKDFKKYYKLPTEVAVVYAALTNEATIQLWTGDKASFKAEPNTEFEMWGGSICGKNLEFIENKKMVQEWYFGEQKEPSIVTIKLHEDKSKTSVELVHTNIPNEAYDDIAAGWDHYYFGALADFYSED